MNVRWLGMLFAGLVCGFAAGRLARPPAEEPVPVFELPRAAELPEERPAVAPVSPPDSPTSPSSRASSPAPAPHRRDPGAPRPSRLGSRRDVLGLFAVELRRAYRRLSGGSDPSEEQIERTVADHGRQLDYAAEGWAQSLWKREERRRRFGELSDPAEVVLQVRTMRREEIAMIDEREPRHRPPLRDDPLDVRDGIERQSATEYFVQGGLIPEGKVFVFDRVEIRAAWVEGHRNGEVRFNVPGGPDFACNAVGTGLHIVHEGLGIMSPHDEGGTTLTVREGVAELRISGRVVPREEAPWRSDRGFRTTVFDADGYLTTEPVLLQLACADRSGRLSLVPDRDRVKEYAERDLWHDPIDFAARQEPRAYVRARGAIPPGKVFEVTRVVWRVRPGVKKCKVEFRLGRDWVLDPRTEYDGETEGTWTGSVVFRSGREDSITIEARRAVVEVRIHGALRDP